MGADTKTAAAKQSRLAVFRGEHHAGRPMSDTLLRDEAITLLLAGHETTALALSWTWFLLGQHPDAQSRMAAEIVAIARGRSHVLDLVDGAQRLLAVGAFPRRQRGQRRPHRRRQLRP